MIKKNLKEFDDFITNDELDNVRSNILRKLAQLDTTLPELAKLIQIEYQTLRRITYENANYVPNLRALYPIASFFEVTVADLLKNPLMPQYIPLLDVLEIENHLNTSEHDTKHERIFCDEHVHVKAFAINVLIEQFGQNLLNTFIMKPYNKIIAQKFILIRDINMHYFFIKVLENKNNELKATIITTDKQVIFNTNNVMVIGIAVKQVLNNDLF